MANVPSPWPSPSVLETLVQNSSGYFIYASTIIKFIDDTNYRPTERLAIVEDGSKESPFDALDQLYMTILCSVARLSELIPILCAIANFRLSVGWIEQLFGLADGDAQLLLRGLHSVLNVPSNNKDVIHSHHASFLDFLNNPTRSRNFYIGGPLNRMDLALSLLKFCERRLEGRWIIPYRRALRGNLIPFNVSLPPSPWLPPMIARLNPCPLMACLQVGYTSDPQSLGWIFRWLPEQPSAPLDVIQAWEDYAYTSFFGGLRPPISHPHLATYADHSFLPSPDFICVFLPVVFDLGLTWAEFRTMICTHRPIVARTEFRWPFLGKSEVHRWPSQDLAKRHLQMIKNYVDTGGSPEAIHRYDPRFMLPYLLCPAHG
ncbi:WD40 repeat-like protein [Mycena sanguinolenta]|uniref:WD40 repeat-like protein n=1 Tax=Mycena sanguinolenta TaxID=230812 RepID=A0A8H7CE82_9AGAR|nr:WD40 repeat-like protein [Mycena sanguinolenta]